KHLSARANFFCSEEISDFPLRRSRRVGAVYRIGVNRLSEVGTNSSRLSLFRVSCAHQFTVFGNGILTFQNLDHHRTGSHEGNQICEETTLFVLSVETFRLLLGQLDHFGCYDFQPSFFEAAIDFANNVLGNRIGFDNRKCAFNSHVVSPFSEWTVKKLNPRLYAGLAKLYTDSRRQR